MYTHFRLFIVVLVLLNTAAGGAQPKHIRAMYRSNPHSSFTIGFSTEIPELATDPVYTLYYSKNDYGTDLAAYAQDHPPIPVTKEVQAFKAQNHYFFRVENLEPKTRYNVVIAYEDLSTPLLGVQTTERYWVMTMSDSPNAPISIISGGDSRQDLEHPDQTAESITIRQEANRMVAKLRPDFVAFGGDYTFAGTPTEWRDWLLDWELTITDDNKLTPIVAAAGNHEYFPFGGAQAGSQILTEIFDVSHSDVYYAITFGGNLFRLYTLNTEVAISGDQSDWLRQDLEATGTSVFWKGAQYHKPIRPHESGKSDLNSAYAEWANPFFDHQVRIVFESDAHVVKTTYPVKPVDVDDETLVDGYLADMNFVQTDDRGIVFVGEGTWAALRDGNDAKSWTQSMGGFNQVKWVWITKDTISLRTVITYDETNSDYVANIEARSEENRFEVPAGIQIWDPEAGPVVHITDNGRTERGDNNEAPVLDLPDVNLVLSNGDSLVDLLAYASDADADSLSFTTQILSGAAVVQTVLTGEELVLTPLTPGVAEIEVVVSDGLHSVSDSMRVEVTQTQAPNQVPYLLVSSLEVMLPETLEVRKDEFWADADGDDVELLSVSTSLGIVGVEEHADALLFFGLGSESGTETVVFEFTDRQDTVQEELEFVLHPEPNSAPEWTHSSFAYILPHQYSETFLDLDSLVSDTDGDALTFSFVSQSNTDLVEFILEDQYVEILNWGATQIGQTTLIIRASDGMETSDVEMVVDIINPTTVAEKQNFENMWSVFPNPFGDHTLSVQPKQNMHAFSVALYSLEGKLIYQGESPDGDVFVFDEAFLHTPVFILQIVADGKVYSAKIVR